MDIRVADMKILDTSLNKDLLGQVITDVVLALLSYVAEGDWEERHELQRQGIAVAKEAMPLLGLKKDSFYRLAKKYEAEALWEEDTEK